MSATLIECRKCGQCKPKSDFSPDKRKKSGVQARCRECCREWHRNNKEYVEDWHFNRYYGISLSDYRKMHDDQNGLCASCGKPEHRRDRRTGEIRKLCVDHCHTTGRVRGLLCDDCNVAVGRMNDDPDRALLLYKYLCLYTDRVS